VWNRLQPRCLRKFILAFNFINLISNKACKDIGVFPELQSILLPIRYFIYYFGTLSKFCTSGLVGAWGLGERKNPNLMSRQVISLFTHLLHIHGPSSGFKIREDYTVVKSFLYFRAVLAFHIAYSGLRFGERARPLSQLALSCTYASMLNLFIIQ